MPHYQDLWRDGQAIEKGLRPCQERWELIAPALANLRRPFILFDLGASRGYFSLRAHEAFGAICILADEPHDDTDFLPRLPDTTLCCLCQRFTADDLEELARAEHFDVVLALSILHHFPEHEARRVAETALQLGTRVIVEYPLAEDTDCCNRETARVQREYLDSLPSTLLGLTSSFAGKPQARKIALFEQPSRSKRKGILLDTFLRFGGVWPTREQLERMAGESLADAGKLALDGRRFRRPFRIGRFVLT